MVAASPVALAGRVVLDLGAGAGATSRAVLAAGGRPLAVDLSAAMLAFGAGSRPPAVVADVGRLPFADCGVGATVSAFCLSHLDDPAVALAEAARVTAAGGPVLAAVFALAPRHPSKVAVDGLAAALGWQPPPWYTHLKDHLEPGTASAERLAGLGRSVPGLAGVDVVERVVDAGLITADALVAWRLGMPQLAPFVAGLAPAAHRSLVADAVAAIGPDPEPLRPAILVLRATAA
jgi:SAM-dependent methyltransferase